MTLTEIRTALSEVRDAVEVPPVDRVAFQRRVRAERRRRTAGRVLVAGAAAAAVASVAALAGGLGGDERRVDPAGDAGPSARVGQTVFFVLEGRLTALDPAGVVHDLDLDAEAVVGWTSERAYVVDDAGRLAVRTVSTDEGGRATFGVEPAPVTSRVQTVALSGDGRYLGWTDTSEVSHRYDLKAEREDLTLPGNAGASAIDVSADGLLLYTADGLVLRDADSAVQVPVDGQWGGSASQLANGHVVVNDRDRMARLYDLRSGMAEPVAALDGFGTLGPYAERMAVLDGGELGVWDGGTVRPLTGLDAVPDDVRWADETTLLVAAHDSESAGLWVCDIDLACARLPVSGEVSLGE